MKPKFILSIQIFRKIFSLEILEILNNLVASIKIQSIFRKHIVYKNYQYFKLIWEELKECVYKKQKEKYYSYKFGLYLYRYYNVCYFKEKELLLLAVSKYDQNIMIKTEAISKNCHLVKHKIDSLGSLMSIK